MNNNSENDNHTVVLEDMELVKLRRTAQDYAQLVRALEKSIAYAKRMSNHICSEDRDTVDLIVKSFDTVLMDHVTKQILRGDKP